MADTAASLAEFNAFRSRMNDIILGAGNLTINRFFRLDGQAYEPGALGVKTNVPFHRFVLAHADFQAARVSTRWVETKGFPAFREERRLAS